jgi:predicted Zn-dependent protease
MAKLFADPSSTDAAKYILLRAEVAQRAQRWSELHELGQQLLKQFSESKVAAEFVIDSAIRLKKYDEAIATYAPFKERDPKDRWVMNGLSEVERFRGDFAAAQKVLLPIVEDGTATESDLNSFAWYSLFTPAGVDKTALEAGERGMQLKANSFPVMHTVASMYAEVGRGKEAYNLLLQAMDAASMPRPESSVWYTLGRIAESYGEYDSALSMYKKVERFDEFPSDPIETYFLAHRHMDTVNALLKPPPSKAAQASAK